MYGNDRNDERLKMDGLDGAASEPPRRRRRSEAALGAAGEAAGPAAETAGAGTETGAQPTEAVRKIQEPAEEAAAELMPEAIPDAAAETVPEAAAEAAPEAGKPAGDGEDAGKEPAAEEPVVQGPDSRVPPEARRMSAAPYGAAEPALPRRPGTRPAVSERRPEPAPRRSVHETRPAAGTAASDSRNGRRPVRPAGSAGNGNPSGNLEATRVGGTVREDERTRISVGYAPGRMRINPRTAQDYVRDIRTAQDYVRDIRSAQEYGRKPGSVNELPEGRYGAMRLDDRDPKQRRGRRHPVLWTFTAILLLIGALLVVILALPRDNGIRENAENLARTVTKPVESLLERKEEPARIEAFSVTGSEEKTAPADVIFSVTTDRTVIDLRLADEDDVDLGAEQTLAENTENNCWTLTFHVKDGYEGLVKLQSRKEDGDWMDTEYTAELAIAPPLAAADSAATAVPGPEESPAAGGEQAGDGTAAPEDGPAPETTAEQNYGDNLWGVEWEEKDLTAEVTAEPTPAPTDTPEPTEEPTATPPLEAAADASAGPELITTTTVYDGSKKIKNYVRAARNLIHMPAGDDYTPTKMGVLTFRGTAFRQNAAVGTVSSAQELVQLWSVEAGSSRGASQTFYGYEWTGQPAIVKWSSQVRAGSNIDEDKKSKTALREVIIAGVDGVIRFLDLEDGVETRSAINVGYPMKGTPSLHPSGYPYMNVGQYTRKMKNKTGTIGLRQFNLYTQKEQKLIDGLDGKMHRGINRYGSFETSALIDRTSDTVVTLGTNGLLYLISLDTSFDYQAGTLTTNPVTIVMSSRAKGEKKDEMVAVEASHAMYDRYVFYADMGGVLRCVDTNYLTPVWAVNTGDAVMSSVALDFDGDKGLDLYTANMLYNRKTGNAQIRRYDALTGREIWCLEVGVAKNTKTKEDVGVKASPVIGQNRLKELAYFTVTGLTEEGCATLGVESGSKAALVAVDKQSGEVRWAKGLSDRSESSPVAVYDADGNGWIIQCVENGEILMFEGITGKVTAEMQIDAQIKASPAVYNDIMVVGTTGKGTSMVVAIRIR